MSGRTSVLGAVTISTLEQAVRSGDRLLLDTTSLIAYLDRREAISPLAMHVVNELVHSGRNSAVVSMISVMEAASLRAAFRLSTADALIVATGVVAQVHHLVTNDADWVRKLQPISGRIRVCHLGHHL
jgi:predicted nucleic acid-binding protein